MKTFTEACHKDSIDLCWHCRILCNFFQYNIAKNMAVPVAQQRDATKQYNLYNYSTIIGKVLAQYGRSFEVFGSVALNYNVQETAIGRH